MRMNKQILLVFVLGFCAFSNDVKTGIVREHYSNGNVSFEGNYTNGKKNGVFRSYDYEGGILSHVEFVHGVKSKVITYDSNNMPLTISYYKGEDKHGPCTTFYNEMKIKSTITFKRGLATGLYHKYYPNGTVEEIVEYDNGKVVKPHLYYSKNGMLLNGICTTHIQKDTINIIGEYLNGVCTSNRSHLRKNGSLYIREYFNSNGVKYLIKIFNEAEKLLLEQLGEPSFKESFQQISYSKKGLIKSILSMKANKYHGITLTFDDNGKLIDKQYFYNGNLCNPQK